MTVNTTQTKARRHARDGEAPTQRPRPEQPRPGVEAASRPRYRKWMK